MMDKDTEESKRMDNLSKKYEVLIREKDDVFRELNSKTNKLEEALKEKTYLEDILDEKEIQITNLEEENKKLSLDSKSIHIKIEELLKKNEKVYIYITLAQH